MKKYLYLALVFSLMLLGSVMHAQNGRITMDVHDVTLEEAMDVIEKQSEYSFLYNKTLVDVSRKVTLKAENQPVRQVLDRLFAGTGISYDIRGRQIVLSYRNAPASEAPEEAVSGSGNVITGRVSDSAGEPLVGVGILIEGTLTGTITDMDGKFSLEVKDGDILIVTSLGYETASVAVIPGRSSYSIVLQDSAEMLDDVVIVGYGVQKKASITGAITNVSGDELKVNATVNTSSALAGTIAGINSRMSDGRPGATTKISIRGMGSPLYIIDGVQQTEDQFNNIDANDIESISILKDASASIYGLRAANGVVVVKTKSGHLNTRHTVNVKTMYGWQEFFRFPQPASAASYVRTKYQSDVIKMADNPSYTPTYTREEYLKWQAGTERGYEGFDWLDYATAPGPQSYVGANISGGSDKVSYYVSLSNTNQDYAIRDFGGFNRTNIQVNINAEISRRFSLGAQVSGRIETTKAPGLGGGDEVGWMLFGSYRNLPTVRPFVNDNPLYPAKTAPSYIWTNFAATTMSKTGEDVRKERAAYVNLNAEYRFTDWLTLKLIGGYSFAHNSRSKQVKAFDLYDYDESTGEYYVVDGERNPELYKSSGIAEDYSGQFTLDFHKQFGAHNVALMVGGEASHHISPSFDFTARPQTDMSPQVNTSVLETLNDYLDSPQARAGFIGRFTYDYDGRYLLELMSCPVDVIDLSTIYLKIYFIGMPVNMVYNFSSALLRAVGDTRRPLYCLAASGVVNVILNLVFVIGFQLSVAGVALATIISQALSAGLVLWLLCREKGALHLNMRALSIHRGTLIQILRIGLPAGLQSTVFSLSNVVIQSAINSFGSIIVAGNSAASNIEGFVYISMNAFSQAAVTFTSQNVGARQYHNIDRVLINCLGCVGVTGLVMGVGATIFGEPLLGIYSSDPAVIDAGMIRLIMICSCYFLCGFMDVLANCLRGLGYSVMPMVVSLVGSCALRLIWIATIFQLFHTTRMLYLSYPVSWGLTVLAHLICFFVVRRK